MMFNISGPLEKKKAKAKASRYSVSVLTKIARKKLQFSKLFSLNILGCCNMLAFSAAGTSFHTIYLASLMNGHCYSDVLEFVLVITLPQDIIIFVVHLNPH